MKKNHSQFLNGQRSDNLKYWKHCLLFVISRGENQKGVSDIFFGEMEIYISNESSLWALFGKSSLLSSMSVYRLSVNNWNQYTKSDQTGKF